MSREGTLFTLLHVAEQLHEGPGSSDAKVENTQNETQPAKKRRRCAAIYCSHMMLLDVTKCQSIRCKDVTKNPLTLLCYLAAFFFLAK